MDFEYIETSIQGPGISAEEWEDTFCGCECEMECSWETKCSCLIGGRDNYTNDGKLLPLQTAPLIECHPNCACSLLPTCRNRLVQHGVQKRLEIFKTSEKGYGVSTLEPIARGEFVCEFAGEVISEEEVKNRFESYKVNDNYTMTLKENSSDGNVQKTFIDPRFKGNIGRFVNHCCDPNLEIVIVRLGRIVPCVGLFAIRDIQIGEELGYDYGNIENVSEKYRKLCHCGAENCRKYLPTTTSPVE